MTINEWLARATKQLTNTGIETARLDCLVLLADLLEQDKAWLLAHPEHVLTDEQQTTLAAQLTERITHSPLAYIRGKTEFYGRDFIVTPDVLVPRPESEAMIDLLKQLDLKKPRIADIGTGSGALGITADLEVPGAVVAAVDIDEACLDVCKRNAVVHAAAISLFSGDLLEPFLQKDSDFKPEILLCNLPYVPNEYLVNQAARHEPRLALFGGSDGLDLFRRLFKQATHLKPQYILTESLPEQHEELAKIAAAHRFKLQTSDDFIQLFTAA